jgi:hypothetical protein
MNRPLQVSTNPERELPFRNGDVLWAHRVKMGFEQRAYEFASIPLESPESKSESNRRSEARGEPAGNNRPEPAHTLSFPTTSTHIPPAVHVDRLPDALAVPLSPAIRPL